MKTFLTILSFFFIQSVFAQNNNAYKHDSLQVEGQYVHYYTKGKGPAILYLQGGPGFSSDNMRAIADSISNYRSVLIDYRGTGKSIANKPDSTWVGYNQILQDVEAVRKKLTIEKWIVTGHSFGGQFTMYYAIKHPQVVTRIIPVSSAPPKNDFMNYYKETLWMRYSPEEMDELRNLAQDTSLTELEKKKRRIYLDNVPYFYNRANISKLFILYPNATDDNFMNWTYFFAFLKSPEYARFDYTKEYLNLPIPVRNIMPRQDAVNDGELLLLNSKQKNGKMIYIERSGHIPWIENPNDFFRVFKESLTD
ncbi:MAG: alpha/beta hydrolase [Flavobacteriaceae bacterium]|nr:alpha/beta hydrolase [Flavobacteriaceae bacterium]